MAELEGREKCLVRNSKGTKKLLSKYLIHFTSSIEAKYFQRENVVSTLFNVILFLLPGERV